MHNDLCMMRHIMWHMICKSAPEFKAAERTMLVSTSRNLAQWTYIPMLLDLIKSEHPRIWLHIKRPIAQVYLRLLHRHMEHTVGMQS